MKSSDTCFLAFYKIIQYFIDNPKRRYRFKSADIGDTDIDFIDITSVDESASQQAVATAASYPIV